MGKVPSELRLKISRAQDHFEYFKAALGLGGSPINPPASSQVHVDNDGNLTYTTDELVVTAEHCILLGECVHQLRSCLDHIVYAMAQPVCTDRGVLRKIQFPVFDDLTKFENSPGFNRLIQVFGAASAQITEIRKTQPYERYRGAPTTDPLWIVSELDNIDKHRTILIVNPSVSIAGTVQTNLGLRPFRTSKQPIVAGTAVFDLGGPLPDPPTEVDVERISPFIVFAETNGLCDGLSVFPLFANMTKAVADTLDRFESKGLI